MMMMIMMMTAMTVVMVINNDYDHGEDVDDDDPKHSGALAANAGAVMDEPSCPLVQVPQSSLSSLTSVSLLSSLRRTVS